MCAMLSLLKVSKLSAMMLGSFEPVSVMEMIHIQMNSESDVISRVRIPASYAGLKFYSC